MAFENAVQDDSEKFTYFPLTNKLYNICQNECAKPGPGHPNHDPNDASCDDVCAGICCPAAFSLDIVFMPFRMIGRGFLWVGRRCCCCFRKKQPQVAG